MLAGTREHFSNRDGGLAGKASDFALRRQDTVAIPGLFNRLTAYPQALAVPENPPLRHRAQWSPAEKRRIASLSHA